VIDAQGTKTNGFASVVYAAANDSPLDPIPADSAAAVIDVVESLDLNELRAVWSYCAGEETQKVSYTPCERP